MNGPYEHESEALTGPVHKDSRVVFERAYNRLELPRLVRDVHVEHLASACTAAGVELGTFDRRVLDWLAGQESSTVQVIVGIIHRAHEAR